MEIFVLGDFAQTLTTAMVGGKLISTGAFGMSARFMMMGASKGEGSMHSHLLGIWHLWLVGDELSPVPTHMDFSP